MRYLLTTCSREKSTAPGTLPAKDRYTSDRIKKIVELAAKTNQPLLFLSGKYGLISANEKIPYYDLLLEEGEVDALVKLANEQAKKLSISEVKFYAKTKDNKLKPYYQVIDKVCKNMGINLEVVALTD